MKEISLFCFVTMRLTKTWCLGYGLEFIIKKFSMSRGTPNWFKMFGVTAGSY